MSLNILVEKHKLIRRLIVLWAVILITVVTVKVFWFTPVIPSGTAQAFGIVTALLTAAIAFYKWSRGREDERNTSNTDGNMEK